MRNRTKFINFYVTTVDLSFQIPANATSGSFDVASKSSDGYTLADGEYEFWFVADYAQITNREIFRAWKVSGRTIYWDRRISPNGAKLHDGGASIQINDVGEILNWFSANCDDFGMVDAVPSALSVAVKGGMINKDVTINTAIINIPASSTGYIVYDFGLRAFAYTTTVSEPNNYFILAQVVSGTVAINTVTDLRAPSFSYKTAGLGTMFLADDGTYKPLVGTIPGGIAYQVDNTNIGSFGIFDVLTDKGLVLTADPANGRVKLTTSILLPSGKIDSSLYDFPSQAEAEAGVENTKVMTALRTKQAIIAKAASTTEKGSVELATIDEALNGAASVVPTCAIAKAAYGFTVGAGTQYDAANSAGSSGTNSGTYVKIKEIACNFTGTWRVDFTLGESTGGSGDAIYGRIYKNGVAYGTERAGTRGSINTFNETLTFAAGDLIQLYMRVANTAYTSNCNNFKVRYALTQDLVTSIAAGFTVNM
jgi:hypothetical protein